MKYERLKENLNVMCMHNHTQGSKGRVIELTNGRKTESQVIDEIVTDCREILGKIEQGTLIELPCKIGDSFYSYQGFKYQCLGIEITNDGIYLRTIYDMKFLYGKDCFLTREEAKAKLKEL